MSASCQHLFAVSDYDLAATLSSGQAFRWRECFPLPSTGRGTEGEGWSYPAHNIAKTRQPHLPLPKGEGRGEGEGSVILPATPTPTPWEGIVSGHWVQLRHAPNGIEARCAVAQTDWQWLADYLQTDVRLDEVLNSFPNDEPLTRAVTACRGLRLLRQPPWECLASFILSSTKQIVQIQQIVGLVCERFGDSVRVPSSHGPVFSFPDAERLAECSEAELRACKMGFRARYLKGSAEMIARGEVDLERLRSMSCEEARAALLTLPGVGRKIADCVLLFAYGFQEAFPVDVWVMRALRQLYFPRRKVAPRRLLKFTATYFGPNAGYAQQYLFHYMRVHERRR
ncbi:MAG: DNA glycosylase [Verrucomicrobiota bacterium]